MCVCVCGAGTCRFQPQMLALVHNAHTQRVAPSKAAGGTRQHLSCHPPSRIAAHSFFNHLTVACSWRGWRLGADGLLLRRHRAVQARCTRARSAARAARTRAARAAVRRPCTAAGEGLRRQGRACKSTTPLARGLQARCSDLTRTHACVHEITRSSLPPRTQAQDVCAALRRRALQGLKERMNGLRPSPGVRKGGT